MEPRSNTCISQSPNSCLVVHVAACDTRIARPTSALNITLELLLRQIGFKRITFSLGCSRVASAERTLTTITRYTPCLPLIARSSLSTFLVHSILFLACIYVHGRFLPAYHFLESFLSTTHSPPRTLAEWLPSITGPTALTLDWVRLQSSWSSS